jgi:prepilin-type N-terminal cleavage/methylation domain-containing protein
MTGKQDTHSRGFTLIEVLVALAIMALVIVGFLSLLDTSARISKVQSALADTQESLRYTMAYMVRFARMAGTGGMPAVTPTSFTPGAVAVQDNVSAGTKIGGLDVLPQTDVLELRGSFFGPMLDVAPALGGSYNYTGPTGTVTVPGTSFLDEPQDTSSLSAAISDEKVVPVLFASIQRNLLGVDDGRSRVVPAYGTALLSADSGGGTFVFTTTGGTDTAAFLALNPGGAYPAGMTDVLRMAVIKDLRFFVANDPGTGVPTLYLNDAFTGSTQPLASDVVDLQVALGCDRDGNGVLTENRATSGGDEWLFNNDRGTTAETYADKFSATDTVPLAAYLAEMRLTLVSRAPAPESDFVQRPIDNEDGRDILADPAYLGVPVQHYRYRSLTERIKLRSIGVIL